MGVKTALTAVVFTTGGKNQALVVGTDIAGMIAECNLACIEITNKLNFIVNDILTPAGTESSNITTLNSQITNLS